MADDKQYQDNGVSNVDVREIELIIKASTIDGRRKGACLFCQEYFMDLYLLAELKTISLKPTFRWLLRDYCHDPAEEQYTNNAHNLGITCCTHTIRIDSYLIYLLAYEFFLICSAVLCTVFNIIYSCSRFHFPEEFQVSRKFIQNVRILRKYEELTKVLYDCLVTTVDMQKPPPDFRTNFEATHPPILIDNGLAILENDKIERHIMKNVPGGYNLFVQDKEVATLIENLYSKLKLILVRNDESKNNALLLHLRKINDHLAVRGTRFLTGDTMCCFDCELMPRLQHIRVAGKYFVDFEIPTDLDALWRYMFHMYQLDAFTQSCPADQDIINHYKLQQMVKMKKHEELETPTFTTSTPVDMRN